MRAYTASQIDYPIYTDAFGQRRAVACTTIDRP